MQLIPTLMMLCAGLLVPPGAIAATDNGTLIHGPRFFSELEAVHEAVRVYNPTSVAKDIEYMGGIYVQEINDQTLYGYTVGAGEPGDDHVTVRFSLPRSSRLVAFWHTHGAAHWSRRYFSPTDTALANHWQMPFYLMNAEGELRVYRPGDAVLGMVSARRLGLGAQGGSARGELLIS